MPRPPEQNPKREHLHQVDQYDSSDELSEENEEYVYSTTTIKVQNPTLPDESVSVISQPRLQVRIGGTLVTVMMDSGASVNILDKNDYKRIRKENTQIQLQETSTHIYAYGATEALPLLGKINTTLELSSKKITTTFYVVNGSYGSLLSHATSVDLGLITIPQAINAVASKESSKDLPQLLHEYNDIFQGISKLKDFQFEIHVDSEVQPVAQPARRIPFHIRQQVEQEINNLEKQGIIEAVEGPTPWVSPVVVVPKPHKPQEIRLCVDLRHPNKSMKSPMI